jgi:hypothetical protein
MIRKANRRMAIVFSLAIMLDQTGKEMMEGRTNKKNVWVSKK